MLKAVVLGTAHEHVFQLAKAALRSDKISLVGFYDECQERRDLAEEKFGVRCGNGRQITPAICC